MRIDSEQNTEMLNYELSYCDDQTPSAMQLEAFHFTRVVLHCF